MANTEEFLCDSKSDQAIEGFWAMHIGLGTPIWNSNQVLARKTLR
jgi:hypothetical protein